MTKLFKDKKFIIWLAGALSVLILTIIFIVVYNANYPANLKNDLDKFLKAEVKLENGEIVAGINDKTIKYEVTVKKKNLVIYESVGSHGYGTVEVWIVVDGEIVSTIPKEIKESYGNTNYEVSTYYFIVNTLQNINYKHIAEIDEFVITGSTTSESNEASVSIVKNVVEEHFNPTGGGDDDDRVIEIDESFAKITEGSVEIQAKYSVKEKDVIIGYIYEIVNNTLYQEESSEKKDVAFSIMLDLDMNITEYHIFKTANDPTIEGNYYDHSKGNRIKAVEQFMDGMVDKALSIVAGYGASDFIVADTTFSQTAVLDAIKVLYNKIGGN